MYTEAEAKEAREDGVDLLEERRLLALSRSAIYQQCLRRSQNQKGGKGNSQKDEKQIQSEAKHMHDYIYTKGLRKAGIQHSLNTPQVGGTAQI